MNTPVSRRSFLLSFVPSWWSRDVALGALIGVGFLALALVSISALRDVGFLGILKGLSGAAGFMFAVWLVVTLVRLSKAGFDSLPAFLKAVCVVCLQFVGFLVACYAGSTAFARWQKEEERPEMIIMFGTIFVFSVLREWEKRRSNQSVQTRPTSRPV